MSDLRSRIDAILPHVQTPGQYVGAEVNSVRTPPEETEVSFCLAFPDTYALGMSHVGFKILYEVLNRAPGVAAERVYAPWIDMDARMREGGLPLYSLESFRPVREFDVLGFSLQYELTFTNVLAMLELAGIPVLAAERADAAPLVIAGGPGAFSPEPMADFMDAFVIGDGEEAALEIAEFVKATRGAPRGERLLELARTVKGVYVPSLYEVHYNSDGTVAAIEPACEGVPERVERRVVRDLDAAAYPTAPVVPYVETVHDRYAVEIMRGCVNRCRFCHAGVNYRPRRVRSIDTIVRLATEGVKATGYDEVGLLSLSTGDYPEFGELVKRLAGDLNPEGVSLSVPSLRVDALLRDIPPSVKGVRRSGLTIAPECASDRLRRAIAKPIVNADLYAGVRAAYEAGWETVKLYFMIGLPGETDEDVRGIAEMANEVCYLRKRVKKSPARVNVSIATFVPKAHTPFQWEAMASREEVLRRREAIRDGLRSKRIRASFHEIEMSMLEGVFSRGDRRLGKVLIEARARGCAFDAWGEGMKVEAWAEAFRAAGVDPEWYSHRERGADEVLPWAHIDGGASPDALAKERELAREALAADSGVDARNAAPSGADAQ
ncbi:MAG: TIGR03960 family B12-binding radical SAM protein [Planctomycetota bacterium]